EAKTPEPIDLDQKELEGLQDYDQGRKWLNMLVRVHNVTLQRDADLAPPSRVSAGLLPDTRLFQGACGGPGDCLSNKCDNTGQCVKPACDDVFPKSPTLVNELMDLSTVQPPLKEGTHLKSIVGVITYFCNLHLAPRTAADF